jgi:chromosome segregation ATPase
MSNKYENYYSYVEKDARNFLDQYYDGFLAEIKEGNTDAYNLIDDDNKLHEWTDDYLDLRDAVEILEQSNNVEEDSGLWEGLEPVRAVESMAFWTLKNDLNSEIREQFKARLEDDKDVVNDKLADLENKLESIQTKRNDIMVELEELQSLDEDDDSEAKIESLEEEIEQFDDEISDVEDAIAEIKDEIDYIETAIEDL